MILRHLHNLTLVAQHGSIARAAEAIRLAQPALSRELRGLERRLEVALLERERRGVRLTAAGSALVEDTKALLARLDDALAATREAGEGRRGRVRVGLGRLALDSPRIGQALAAIRARYPDVHLDVAEISPFASAESLRRRVTDLAIGSYLADEHRGLRTDLLFEERIDCVLVAASDPLARAASLSLDELRDQLFLGVGLSFKRGYSALMDALHTAGVARYEGHATIESIYALVAAGRGWTTAHHALRARPPRGTAAVPLRGLDLPLPVYLRRRAREPNRAVSNVAALLLEELGPPGTRRRRDSRPVARGASRTAAAPAHSLELRQLDAFVAAAEERSLSQAAERLGITQSGVSRRVRALERAVGSALLDRVASGVMSTMAGEILYAEAIAAQQGVRQAIWRARRVGGGERPACRIGALAPELTGGLQHLALQRLGELEPDALFEVSEMLPDDQLQALRDRRIDVALAGGAAGWRPHASLSHVMLTDDPIECAMVPEGHRWVSRAWVTATELATEPFLFIGRAAGPRLFDGILRAFAEIGLAPVLGDTFGGPRSVWRAVTDGMGWTIGSRSQRGNPPPGLVAVPVEGLHISWGLALCWRRDESDPLVRRVLDVFRETRNPEVSVVVATVRASHGPWSVTAPDGGYLR